MNRPRKLLPWLLAISILWAIISFLTIQWTLHKTNENDPNVVVGGGDSSLLFLSEKESTLSSSTLLVLPPPRFLLGIFSHDLYRMEQDRRQIVRDTYLNFYKNHSTMATKSDKNRICALSTILHNRHDNNKSNNNNWPDGCQMAYTFVVGGGVNGSQMELLNATTISGMLTETSHPESDVISLDIQENGEFGKSTTWFRFATLVSEELQLPIDYIVKTDSDALLIPHRFFGWISEQESIHNLTTRSHIYGGVSMDKTTCGWPHHDHCAQLRAPIYMGGALYLVSLDLATYVTSSACPRQELFLPHEDMAMANYIFSKIDNITTFSNPDAYLSTWKHPIKSPKRMWNTWRKFLTARRKRLRTKQEERSNSSVRE